MEDIEIIDLYWNRNEEAIRQTDLKYGKYLKAVAMNILNDHEDASTAVNDTYLKTWNVIPPQRPNAFLAWLSRITRSLSIDRLRYLNRKRRSASQYDLSLDELGECIGENSVNQEYDLDLLKDALNQFLRSCPEKNRNLFLCRYFYFDSLSEAAKHCGFSESAAKTQLFRMRQALRTYLEKEGFLS